MASSPWSAASIWSIAFLNSGFFIELLVANFCFEIRYGNISLPCIFALMMKSKNYFKKYQKTEKKFLNLFSKNEKFKKIENSKKCSNCFFLIVRDNRMKCISLNDSIGSLSNLSRIIYYMQWNSELIYISCQMNRQQSNRLYKWSS